MTEMDKQDAKAALQLALDTIFWMSGSKDFAPEGQAYSGWQRAQADIKAIEAAIRRLS